MFWNNKEEENTVELLNGGRWDWVNVYLSGVTPHVNAVL